MPFALEARSEFAVKGQMLSVQLTGSSKFRFPSMRERGREAKALFINKAGKNKEIQGVTVTNTGPERNWAQSV